jgi:6,7-dimethyl-8-ribityllumazine synthase
MKKIHIIVSEFNNPIPEQLLQGALRAFKDAKFPEKDIVITRVPGAFELPIAALTAGQRAFTSAVICLGAVIRGDTSHYDYVCAETARGIMDVGLRLLKPVIFGVGLGYRSFNPSHRFFTSKRIQAPRRHLLQDRASGHQAERLLQHFCNCRW